MESGLRRCRSSYDLTQCGSFQEGSYRSQWFQGLELQMEWLRLSLEGTEEFEVCVYAADEPTELLPSEPTLKRRAKDLLLYGVYGKYLCFTVTPAAKLRGFFLEFPGHSLDEGLPSVLQGDQTLRTLLGVVQSRFMDLNREIWEFPKQLNPEGPDNLEALPLWLGAARWCTDVETRTKLLPYASLLTRLRGTRKGLVLLSKLLTGVPCEILECWQLEQQGHHRENQQLYGRKGEGITILLPHSAALVSQFQSLLPDFVPVGVPYTLVYLEDNAPMDGYSYADWNTTLHPERSSFLDDPEGIEPLLE